MNYYEHHLGDYVKDAGHLSMIEDGAYRRLLDAYYSRERALPADLKECCKLARASSKPEREAVAYVLREFFELRSDGYHQGRADKEIGRFQDKQAKARRSANARWNRDESQSEIDANACPNGMRTHSEGNAPRARPQSPDTKPKASTPESPSLADPPSPAHAHVSAREEPPTFEPGQTRPAPAQQPTAAGTACRLMRAAGCTATNPSHPDLVAALAEGVTPEALADAAREAVERKAGRPFAWAIATARSRHAEGARAITTTAGTAHEAHRPSLAERAAAAHRSADERDRLAGIG